MPEGPGFVGDVKSTTAREWDDPRMVPANEIGKWMDEGWEPCGACLVPATNNETGQQSAILAYCIRRKFSPVRQILEGTSKLARARLVQTLPRLAGSR